MNGRARFWEQRGVLAGLLPLPLLLALPCFFGHAWAEGDLLRQFQPWKELGRQMLRQGQLPLWNPYAYCGMPLLGNFQSALLYPPHLPFYVLDFAPALGLHLGFHFLWGALGLFFLARALGLSKTGAFLAALIWQCNAFLMARVEFMSALAAIAWTPWILWSVAARRGIALTACLVAMQGLAGYPPELAYTLAAALALAAALGEGRWRPLVEGYALGLCAAAAQLLPGLELITQSSRLAGAVDGRLSQALDWSGIWAWLWPFARQPWTQAFSLSLPALLLAPWARGRMALLAFLMACAGLALSSGIGAGLIPNRHPGLALGYVSLGLALLSGMGADRILKRPGILLVGALGAIVLVEAALPWVMRGNLVDAAVYRPSKSAEFLSSRISPGMRMMLSPAVQEERDSRGASATLAWSAFGSWLQANTSLGSGLHDANGYDPLAPAAVVDLLNAASFPVFGAEGAYMDLLGVEATVDWDRKAGRYSPAITRRKGHPLRARMVASAQAPLLALDQRLGAMEIGKDRLASLAPQGAPPPLALVEDSPSTLRLQLPQAHGAGWVFVNDTYFPGWRAWVDGREEGIHRALGAFRAVAVDASAREVVMRYQPWSVALGFLLSAAAWMFIFVLRRP